jgi:hypothetical protein
MLVLLSRLRVHTRIVLGTGYWVLLCINVECGELVLLGQKGWMGGVEAGRMELREL